MKMDQKSLAKNKSESGGSKTPKQPGKSCSGMKSLDQKKVVSYGVHAKREK
jgi:hypothetical protein